MHDAQTTFWQARLHALLNPIADILRRARTKLLIRRPVLALRLPRYGRPLDDNHLGADYLLPRMAEGIVYIDRDSLSGRELWLINEDWRQPVAVPGLIGEP